MGPGNDIPAVWKVHVLELSNIFTIQFQSAPDTERLPSRDELRCIMKGSEESEPSWDIATLLWCVKDLEL